MFSAKSTAEEVAAGLANQIKGKTVLITGVSREGLGYEAARAISLQQPGLLVLAGRSASKLDETESDFKAVTPHLNIKKLILDLGSLDQVKTAASEVDYPVDVLINNAGIGSADELIITKDGFEQALQVNFLAPFLFTSHIFPRILEGRDRRIVNLTSDAHNFNDVLYDDMNFSKGNYDPFKSYAQSKTADILFSVALASKFGSKGVTSFSVHPGAIPTVGGTAFVTRNAETLKGFGYVGDDNKLLPEVTKTYGQGGATHVYAAFAPDIASQSGGYCADSSVANDKAAPYSLDKANAERLWTVAEELLHEKFYQG